MEMASIWSLAFVSYIIHFLKNNHILLNYKFIKAYLKNIEWTVQLKDSYILIVAGDNWHIIL
jgi:hypothetical protein